MEDMMRMRIMLATRTNSATSRSHAEEGAVMTTIDMDTTTATAGRVTGATIMDRREVMDTAHHLPLDVLHILLVDHQLALEAHTYHRSTLLQQLVEQRQRHHMLAVHNQ